MSKLNGKWINKDADHLTHSGDDLKIRFSDTEAPDTNKVWSSAKISTISGSLQQQLDNKAETAVNLGIGEGIFASKSGMDLQFKSLVAGDNIALFDDGNNITISGAGAAGGVTNHALLNNLDYASSAHTGFASSVILATTSGALQQQIDAKPDSDHIHDDLYYTETELDAGQLDNRYYTESEVNTISGSLQIQIDAKPDADHTHTGWTDEMEYFILSGGDVTNKFVALGNTPVSPAEVGLDIIGGCAQFYGVDYTVSGTQVIWNGFALDGVFEAGDEFRVMYSY